MSECAPQGNNGQWSGYSWTSPGGAAGLPKEALYLFMASNTAALCVSVYEMLLK